jgi:HTH-type transcriptional regulator/antitoxin HigA
LLRFFAVSTPEAWKEQWLAPRASFRRSPTYASHAEALSVWLRWGERQASVVTVLPFDARKLRAILPRIRELALMHPLALHQRLTEELAQSGVILLLIPELPGTRVMGAIHWIGTNPVVQLSLRHKSDDQFWFALFHELAHVLNGERRHVYLDPVGVQKSRSGGDRSK